MPGVSITVRRDDTVRSASSTEIDGTFKLTLPDASYQLTAELTGFVTTQKEVTVTREMCAQTVDLTMTLTPRVCERTGDAPAPPNGRGVAGAADGGVADHPQQTKALKKLPNAVSNRWRSTKTRRPVLWIKTRSNRPGLILRTSSRPASAPKRWPTRLP